MVDILVAVDDSDFVLPQPVLDALKPTIRTEAANFLSNSDVVEQAAALAVSDALEDADIGVAVEAINSDFEGAIGDKNGNPTWMQFNDEGDPTPDTLSALSRKGIGLSIQDDNPGYVGAIGDETGRATWIQYDKDGLPTERALLALYDRGVPRSQPVPGMVEGGVADGQGNLTWLQFDKSGRPTPIVRELLQEILGIYVGPTEPRKLAFGQEGLWFKTDGAGNLLGIFIGKGAL